MKDRFNGIMLAWLFLSDFKFPKNRLNGQLNVLKIFTLQKQVQETRREATRVIYPTMQVAFTRSAFEFSMTGIVPPKIMLASGRRSWSFAH
jgi:hypothetical protein